MNQDNHAAMIDNFPISGKVEDLSRIQVLTEPDDPAALAGLPTRIEEFEFWAKETAQTPTPREQRKP